jgi:hypothetical protein
MCNAELIALALLVRPPGRFLSQPAPARKFHIRAVAAFLMARVLSGWWFASVRVATGL